MGKEPGEKVTDEKNPKNKNQHPWGAEKGDRKICPSCTTRPIQAGAVFCGICEIKSLNRDMKACKIGKNDY